MPTPETAEYPKPKDAYEFEDIVWDIFKRKWNDPQAQRYGSSGDAQQGVDVYGQPREYSGRYVGVQCKRYNELNQKVIDEEIRKAEGFIPPLAHYIIATTVSRNARLQKAVRLINQERESQNKFTVEIQFWEDLTKELAKEENQDLLRKHFPNWYPKPAGERTTWTVPYPSLEKQFIGRQSDLDRLAERIEEAGRVGIFGMGGLGKTQLAVEYAYLYKETYPHGVFWLNATNPLLLELAELAKTLGLAGKQAPPDQAAFATRDYLEKNPGALLIIDNVENPNELNQQLAPGLVPSALKGRLLFTTRQADFPINLEAFEIKVLPEEDALHLLLRGRAGVLSGMTPDLQAAREIVVALGGLPLALELAAAYLAEDREIALIEYVQWLREDGGLAVVDESEVDPEKLATRHETAVRGTLSRQWQRLEDHDAKYIFLTAGQLGKGSLITTARLAMMAGIAFEARPGRTSPFRKALNKLHNITLIEILSDERVRLHPLVYDFAHGLANNPGELQANMAKNLLLALQDVSFFERQIQKRGVIDLIADLDKSRELAKTAAEARLHDAAKLVKIALLSSAQILDSDPHQLSGQLTGRLAGYPDPIIQGFLQKVHESTVKAWLRPITPSLYSPDDPLRAVLSGHEGTVHSLAITPDGERAISVGNSNPDITLKVWDLHNCLEIFRVDGEIEAGGFNPVGLTPDGAWALCAVDNRIKRWNIRTKTIASPLEGHQGRINWLAIADASPVAVSCSDLGELVVWDFQNWQLIRRLPAQGENIERILITPDGKTAMSISDSNCQIWDVSEGSLRAQHEMVNFISGGHAPGAFYLSPDGRWAQVGTYRWNFDDQDWSQNFNLPDRYEALALADDARILFAKENLSSNLQGLNVYTGSEIFTLQGGASQAISTLAVTPDGNRCILAYYDHYLRLWEVPLAKKLAQQPEALQVEEIHVLPGGKWAVVRENGGRVEIFDIATGTQDSSLEAKAALEAAIQEEEAHQAQNGRFIEEFIKPAGLIKEQSDWDEQSVYTPERNEAILDQHSGQALTTYMSLAKVSEAEEVEGFDWAADMYCVRFWDPARGNEPTLLRGHTSPVLAGEFTEDGSLAVTSAVGRLVRVWDLKTGKQRYALRGHKGIVFRVRLDPSERYAVSASEDRSIKVWDLKNGTLVTSLTTDAPLFRCSVGRHAESGKIIVVAVEKAGRLHFLMLEGE